MSREVGSWALGALVALGGCDERVAEPEPGAPLRDESLWGPSEKLRQVCGSGTYVHGIDVSKWQATIDWPSIAAADVGFVFVRASYGRTGVDDRFDANWAGAKDAGLLRGAYHYFNASYDGASQAANFLAAFDDPDDLGELPIVLDVEDRDAPPAPAVYAQRVQEFVDAIEDGTGRAVMIYSGGSMWDTYVKSADFTEHPIWVAHYFNDRSTSHCPNTPDAWPRWTIWQHSEQGTIPGIVGAVDLDVFDGTSDDLLALAFHRAKFVAQSFPYASQGVVEIPLGRCVEASITLRNTGGIAWDESVELALSSPRDRSYSELESPSWLSASRLARVEGRVEPGESQAFVFEVCGNVVGTHDVRFNLVRQAGARAIWFSDPMQGGPSDTRYEGVFRVVSGTEVDAGVEDAGTDAGTEPGDAGVEPMGDGGDPWTEPPPRHHGGCELGEGRASPATIVATLGLSALLVLRRRARAPRRPSPCRHGGGSSTDRGPRPRAPR